MAKTRVGVIGSGWRSTLYLQAAKDLPDEFEIVSMRVRSEEKKARFEQQWGIPVTTSMDEFKSAKPDFVVDAVNRGDPEKGVPGVYEVAVDLISDGIPVLAETPPAESVQQCVDLWNLVQQKNVKMLVAENYFAEPDFAAKLEAAARGYLGDVQTVTVSNTHEYHAISVMRLLLDAQYTPLTVIGKRMDMDLTLTQDKDGSAITDGRTQKVERFHLLLNFDNGKTGIYDFAIAQYWSAIRSRYFMVQGSKGEIKDDEIWYLDQNNSPRQSRFISNKTADGKLINITVDDKVLYENTLLAKGVGSNLGVTHMMLNMKRYLETGEAPYSFASAMQDTYITRLFIEAGRNPFKPIRSEQMPWMP